MHHLFDVFGIELEYMIVRNHDGKVAPLVDQIMIARCGKPENDCRLGPCEVSNELAAHVFEIKTPQPAADLNGLEGAFAETIHMANLLLAGHDCHLLPGPMHPTMDPQRESHLWPHGNQCIYELYNTIFDCRGHGWLNLQSCHLNLPFAGDEEFALLHSAITIILPFLPALAAGSPFREGRETGFQDTRLETYRRNQERCPLITGNVIPEPVFSETEYREKILAPMYAQIRPLDPDGLLQEEWLNSRGAIARFDRGAVEIRLLDMQESPRADMALCRFFIEAIRRLVEAGVKRLKDWVMASPTLLKSRQLDEVIRRGMAAPLVLPECREAFGLPSSAQTVGDLWRELAGGPVMASLPPDVQETVETLLRKGNLAVRQLAFQRSRGVNASFQPLLDQLSQCLASNQIFLPDS